MPQYELTTSRLGTIADKRFEVAILPMGATEAHGRHLPYATDTIQVEAIAAAACSKAEAAGAKTLLLPAIPYGVNENTLGFPWTMSLRPSTLLQIMGDIVSCVEHHGIPKMVILNGHGGNEFQPHLRELCRRTSVQITLVNWYQVCPQEADAIFEAPGEHADEMETSLLLHLRPELANLADAGTGATREPRFGAMREGWAWVARPWDRFTYDSGYGDPRAATGDKGQRYLEAVADRLAEFLVELSAAPVDELYPYKPGEDVSS